MIRCWLGWHKWLVLTDFLIGTDKQCSRCGMMSLYIGDYYDDNTRW